MRSINSAKRGLAASLGLMSRFAQSSTCAVSLASFAPLHCVWTALAAARARQRAFYLMLAKLRGALKRTCEKSADLGDRELYVVVILK